MDSAIEFLRHLGTTWFGAFWLPMLAWSLLAFITIGALHVWRTVHPVMAYAAILSVQLALPIGLLLAQILEWPTPAVLLPEQATPLALNDTIHTPIPTANPQIGVLPPTSILVEHAMFIVGLFTLLAGCAAVIMLGLSIHHRYLFLHWRRALPESSVPEGLVDLVNREAVRSGIRRPIKIVVTSQDVPPLTYGTWRPILVIPETIIHQADLLRIVIGHEMIHIQRFDDLFHRVGLMIDILFVFNPVVRYIQRMVAFFRELSCDATVLAQSNVSPRTYAGLLYRLSGCERCSVLPVLPMSTTQPELTRRIMAMKQFPTSFLSARTAFYRGLVLLGILTLIISSSKTLNPQGDAQAQGGEIFVVIEEMPSFPGGTDALMKNLQQTIKYPEIARKAGVQGTLLIGFTIDQNGSVKDVKALRTIGAGCEDEAIRAIKSISGWKPGKQRGKPVPVQLSVPFEFKMGEKPTIIVGPDVLPVERTLGVDGKKAGNLMTGRVTDTETADPLAGANIVVEGSEYGTVTEADGRFTLDLAKVQKGETAVISYVGYHPLKMELQK